jgi:WD40 repeat protein
VFASGYYEVLVWGFDGQLRGRIPTRGRFVADLEWNSGASSLVIGSGEPGKIGWVESVPWSLPSVSSDGRNVARSRRVVHWTCRDIPLDISVSPDGTRLGIGNQDGVVLVVEINSNNIVWKEAAHAAAITSVDWSEDGLTLLTASRDRTAKSYDARDGQVLTSYTDHERVVASIHSLKHGVITLDETGTIRLFPGLSASNSRASRNGFRQGTDKLAATQDFVVVPMLGALRRFKLRKEEVTESKGEDGKEKKKTIYSIENLDALELASQGIDEAPTSITVSRAGRDVIVAGFASGDIVVWVPEGNVIHRIQNRATETKP